MTPRTTALVLACMTADVSAQETASATRPATVIVQCPRTDDDRALKAQLEAARDRLAKAEEEATMPDHAVAALLLSDRPGLISLVRVSSRDADHGNRHAEIDVYLSPRAGETMIAIVVHLRNPRNEGTWEPREAWVKIEPPAGRRGGVRWMHPIPAAVRSDPQRVAPGQPARIALVFDKADVDLDHGPVTVELLRRGEWELAFELQPSDVAPSSPSGTPLRARWRP